MATTKNSNSQRDMDNANIGNSSKINFDKKQREASNKGNRSSHGSTNKGHK